MVVFMDLYFGKIICFEFWVFRRVGVIEGPLSERDIFAEFPKNQGDYKILKQKIVVF